MGQWEHPKGIDTVDGRNPASQLVDKLSPLFTWVLGIPGGCVVVSSDF